MASVFVFTRRLVKSLHYIVIPVYFYFLSSCVYVVISVTLFLVKGSDTKWSWEVVALLVGSCSLEFVGQIGVANALQYEKAARIASLEYLQLILGFLFDILVFKGHIGVAEIVGSFLISASSLTVTLLKCWSVIS